MKMKDVRVGGRYYIRVAGRLKLDIVEITHEQPGKNGLPRKFYGTNEQTGRTLGPFTSARLRGEAPPLKKYEISMEVYCGYEAY